MSAQDLTNEEVIHHTAPFVTLGTAENRAIAAWPIASGLVPLLVTARSALSRPLGDGNPELARLTQALLDEDIKVHDPLARALYYALDAAALLFPHPGLGSACANAKADVYRPGLSIARKSYVEESGAVPAREELRRGTAYPMVWSLALGATTYGDVLNRWNASGRRVGELHRQRESTAGAGADPSPADILDARRQCLRIVDAIQNTMRLEGASNDVVNAAFAAWDEAVHVATLRARATTGETPAAPTTPATPPAT